MPHLKTESRVLPVLFLIALLSSVNTAPTFMRSTASKCNRLNCITTGSNGTPAGATSPGDGDMIEITEENLKQESLITVKRGASTDLNLSGNDQLTDVVSLLESQDNGMKVTTGDVLLAVSDTQSKRIAKSATEGGCTAKRTVGLSTTETTSETIPMRAMCQWVYTQNVSETRNPPKMEFAELKDGACAKCIDSTGRVVTDSHCELFYYSAPVERRINGKWVKGTENVPLAGVCVKTKQ
ncbi:uncharacterized protein LOC117299473 [Asterias rubens]|uniref:uncharacterized protein LOC117299473 n=1 Tax=Asterias rubens TaxID=7604 RepID=UPI00145542AC|nr:uncharacterized protein LOC117299473 [Asterias rubens]